MGYYGGSYGYPQYVTVAEKKVKAEKKLAQLIKKDKNVAPIVIAGTKIATTWWGKAWCNNLESYADYRDRIGRGKTYVKNGFVLDLRIEEGIVRAKVYGRRLYEVTIKIDKLSAINRKNITAAVGHKIGSIEDLINGNFPKEFGEIFLTQDKGLFPSPNNIHFDCSCPDWADMCKHVAAVLYGIGARLDADPLLFFKLRGIDVDGFIQKTIDAKMKSMLKNAKKKSMRIIKDADISKLFGI